MQSTNNEPFPNRKYLDLSVFVFNNIFLVIREDDAAATWQSLGQFLQGSYLTSASIRVLN